MTFIPEKDISIFTIYREGNKGVLSDFSSFKQIDRQRFCINFNNLSF